MGGSTIFKMGAHPSLTRNDEVIAKTHELVRAYQISTIKEVSKGLGISFGSC
jgi:hypothetical protein